ncbi:MAG: NfeD family protein [Clostridia bacterium]|nr:NfeD family protein [Clostridia bacterium]
MENIMTCIWLAVTVIAIIIELTTPQLISIWFAVGGVVCIAFSFIPGLPWWGEIIIFSIISVALLFALRPFLAKYLKSKNLKTNIDRIIGKEIRMLSQADFDNLGTAKLGDVVWTVKSADGDVLRTDEIVKIVDIDGNKLIAAHISHEGSATSEPV